MPRKSLYLIGLIVALGIGVAIGQSGLLSTPIAEAGLTLEDVDCPTIAISSCKKGPFGSRTFNTADLRLGVSGADNIQCGGGMISWYTD